MNNQKLTIVYYVSEKNLGSKASGLMLAVMAVDVVTGEIIGLLTRAITLPVWIYK